MKIWFFYSHNNGILDNLQVNTEDSLKDSYISGKFDELNNGISDGFLVSQLYT